jgi:hypothetical protein
MAATTTAQKASPGLHRNAISAVSSMVIGVASTAPGFATAVTLGLLKPQTA